MIRASVILGGANSRKHADQAVEALAVAAPHEVGNPAPCSDSPPILLTCGAWLTWGRTKALRRKPSFKDFSVSF